MHLTSLEERLAVCRLEANAEARVPTDATFFSATRTADELSIVCSESDAPERAEVEPGWRAFKVEGTLEFSEVGVISTLTALLAEAGIPIFVVSTFDTDYILVKGDILKAAFSTLAEHGYEVSAEERE